VRDDAERASERRDDAGARAAREAGGERVKNAGAGETTTMREVTRKSMLMRVLLACGEPREQRFGAINPSGDAAIEFKTERSARARLRRSNQPPEVAEP